MQEIFAPINLGEILICLAAPAVLAVIQRISLQIIIPDFNCLPGLQGGVKREMVKGSLGR